ncbi:MAG: leucine-rich repeat domain-containing protein [Clostridia bacterium]|nr:leucine-rich repeat domain-containing protein [Clostridia bacterium]
MNHFCSLFLACLMLLLCLVGCGEETPEKEYAEGLTYRNLPDGTCAVQDAGTFEGEVLRLPDKSPDGKSITQIDGYAFENNETLTEVYFPSSLKVIGPYAFAGCAGISSVTLPDGLTEIGMYAFSRCTELNQIYLGSSLTTVGDGAFNACSGLTYAFWRGDAASWRQVDVGSGNSAATLAGVLHFYSEKAPREDGFFWYYQGGAIRIWG